MPETTFLQIQGRDQSASRVLELPVGPVRIGRGSYCEVRLGDEPGLGDVQCLLRRRGSSWHFQPVGPPGHVWIDGRPADNQRPLPVGSSLRVGDHWLTLRSAANPPDVRGSFAAPIAVEPRTVADPTPPPSPAPAPDPAGEPGPMADEERPRPASATAEDEDRLRRWQSRLEQRERWLKNRQDERAWEARWKAAGETIRGRGTPPPATPSRPTSPRSPAPTPAPTPPSPPVERTPPSPPVERRFPARPPERVVEPRAAVPLHRPAEPARRPVPPRVPVRPPATATPPTPRPRPEPATPTSRALAAIPAPVVANEPEVAPPPIVKKTTLPATAEPLPPSERAEPAPIEVVEVQADPVPTVEVVAEAVVPPIASDVVADADIPTLVEDPAAEADSAPMISGDAVVVEAEVGGPEASEIPPETPGPDAAPIPEPALPAVAMVTVPADADFAALAPEREPGRRDAEWPSARTIFDARATRPLPDRSASPGAKRRVKVGPMPTEAVAPGQWTLPLWLGWFPTAAVVLAAGVGGLGLAWAWTGDAIAMNEAVGLALRPEKTPAPSVDPAKVPHPRWWQTTSGQAAAWAIAVERSVDGEDRGNEVRSLIAEARNAAPLSGTSRFVVEWPASTGPDAVPEPVAVGRTRDVVSLAWTGRNLRQAGKLDEAINAYRAAFDLAGRSGAVAADPPAFDETRQPRRYMFPHEALLEWVARDMAEAGDWSPEQWSAALPDFAVAPLAAARALQDRDRSQADRLVERVVAGVGTEAALGYDEAEHRAAGAEALAMRSRWADASDQYRKAIEAAGDDATRRMWWVNLAEVAGRSGDESARASALERATVPDPRDEIAKRALKSQDLAGLGRTTSRP